jgi:hypothetical protein
MFKKRTTATNTLVLIHEWSMDGARGDLDGRFGSPLDIHALVAERSEKPSGEVPPPTQSPLLMKPAGEDDWRPLLVGVPDPA